MHGSHEPSVCKTKQNKTTTTSVKHNKVKHNKMMYACTVLRVKDRTVVWVQNGYKCIGVYSCDCMAGWEMWLAATAQRHKRV